MRIINLLGYGTIFISNAISILFLKIKKFKFAIILSIRSNGLFNFIPRKTSSHSLNLLSH